MDFIDPRIQRIRKIQLLVGYGLVTIALVLTTIILLFLAYGYAFGENGQIIQNGLIFVSSTPNPAQIYLNGQLNSSSTNSRLQLPAGQYKMELKLTGYRTWVRAVGVEGGSVERFDYPFLFPTKLVTTDVEQYATQPQLILQSLDRKWLLIQQISDSTSYNEYDLSNQPQLASSLTTVTIPADILTTPAGAQSWKQVEWSNDSRHVLLQHTYQGGSEYILLDRQTPADSVNLTRTLNLSATAQLTLLNGKYDQYYIFDPSSNILSTATISAPQLVTVVNDVLSYKSYGSNTIIYATSNKAPSGKVNIDVLQGGTTYTIRQEAVSTNYLLDVAQYNGNWYVVADGSSGGDVYVYENPMGDLSSSPTKVLVPIYILKVDQPTYESFSANFQFIMAENDTSFAVYDAQNQKAYSYQLKIPIDNNQHATWMDGDRLMVTSGGKLVIFDYDDANQQTLQAIQPSTVPYFDPAYKWSYDIAPIAISANTPTDPNLFALTSTSMLAQ